MQKRFFNKKDAENLINIYGFSLFPVHGINEQGECTCGHSDCTNKGKHPATPNGLKDATRDLNVLAELWAKRKGLNVGIATGAPSDVFVIDIDSEAGEASLNALGQVPETLTVLTGKGKHLFFKYPNQAVITKRGIIEGVDVRGDGGYVVGVGSNHIKGHVYEFENPLSEIAEAPSFILELVIKSRIQEPVRLNVAPTLVKSSLNLESWSIADVREHLDHINPDCGYDEWVKVGMALHAAGYGFNLWDEWSRKGAKYQNDTATHWKSFKAGGGVSYGTIVKMAKDGGWSRKHTTYALVQNAVQVDEFDPETGEVIEKQQAASGLYYIKAKDIKPKHDVSDFVQGTLQDGALSVVYGESNCGKTFFMTDMCFHVAQGKEWNGRRVEQGGVLYAALEGAHGLTGRVEAYKRENMLLDIDMPFAMMPCQLDFFNPENNINEFIDLIKRAADDMGSVRLVVIDTLARALMGGDENSGQDMGLLVSHADRIRYEVNCHLTFIHHSGKDKARGARGHSSLRAAVDTEIEISRDDGADYSTVRFVKQREMEMAQDIAFGLKSVEIGRNKYDEVITSCVVIPKEAQEKTFKVTLTPMQTFVFDSIVAATLDCGVSVLIDGNKVNCVDYTTLRDYLDARGLNDYVDGEKAKSATQAARVALKKKGKINFNKNYIWIV